MFLLMIGQSKHDKTDSNNQKNAEKSFFIQSIMKIIHM